MAECRQLTNTVRSIKLFLHLKIGQHPCRNMHLCYMIKLDSKQSFLTPPNSSQQTKLVNKLIKAIDASNNFCCKCFYQNKLSAHRRPKLKMEVKFLYKCGHSRHLLQKAFLIRALHKNPFENVGGCWEKGHIIKKFNAMGNNLFLSYNPN